MPKIVVDSSVLNHMLSNEDSVDLWLLRLSRYPQVELVLVNDVTVEICAGEWVHSPIEGVHHRLKMLRKLLSHVRPGQIRVCRNGFKKVVAQDLRWPGKFNRIFRPVPDPHQTRLFDEVQAKQFYLEMQDVIAKKFQASERLFELDRMARRRQMLDVPQALRLLQNFRQDSAKFRLLGLLAHQSQKINLISGTKIRKAVWRGGCRIISAFASFYTLHHLIVTIPVNDAPLNLRQMFPIHQNDRTDVFIASSAAYCSHFATEDQVTRHRCEFLKHQREIAFDSIDYASFERLFP